MSPLDALTTTASRAVTGLSHREFLLKSIIYRIVSVLVTIIVVFLFTQDLVAAFNIGLVVNLLKTLLYYAFEHAWKYLW